MCLLGCSESTPCAAHGMLSRTLCSAEARERTRKVLISARGLQESLPAELSGSYAQSDPTDGTPSVSVMEVTHVQDFDSAGVSGAFDTIVYCPSLPVRSCWRPAGRWRCCLPRAQATGGAQVLPRKATKKRGRFSRTPSKKHKASKEAGEGLLLHASSTGVAA